jgi:hypothetical protein
MKDGNAKNVETTKFAGKIKVCKKHGLARRMDGKECQAATAQSPGSKGSHQAPSSRIL